MTTRPMRVGLTIEPGLPADRRAQILDVARALIDRSDVLLTVIASRDTLDRLLQLSGGVPPSREIVIPTTSVTIATLWIRHRLTRALRHRNLDVLHCTGAAAPARSASPVLAGVGPSPTGSTVRDWRVTTTGRTTGASLARLGLDTARMTSTDESGGRAPADVAEDLAGLYQRIGAADQHRPGAARTPVEGRDRAPRVAIVNDWLLNVGGGERVTYALWEMFPDAPVYTSQFDPTDFDWFEGVDVHTTWLRWLPRRLKKFLPPLRALAFRQLDLSGYDLVLSSSGAEGKAVRTRREALHITYCHSPSHYYWSRYDEYLESPGFGRLDPVARFGLRLLVRPLRLADFRGAQHADVVVVNSSHIRSEVARIYRRGSEVVHPPVDVARIAGRTRWDGERSGYVIAGRQTAYKRFDLAVLACTELGRELVVLGDGPEHDRLRAVAGPTVRFVRRVSDDEWAAHLGAAEAFLFPGVDDFGITPVEAMAAGTPVIAYRAGGALEYVERGATGVFFDEQTVASLVTAIRELESLDVDHDKIRAAAERFSADRFRRQMGAVIARHLGEALVASS